MPTSARSPRSSDRTCPRWLAIGRLATVPISGRVRARLAAAASSQTGRIRVASHRPHAERPGRRLSSPTTCAQNGPAGSPDPTDAVAGRRGAPDNLNGRLPPRVPAAMGALHWRNSPLSLRSLLSVLPCGAPFSDIFHAETRFSRPLWDGDARFRHVCRYNAMPRARWANRIDQSRRLTALDAPVAPAPLTTG